MDGSSASCEPSPLRRIGEWRFDSEAQTLDRGGQVVRLEHRAARLLDLLADRRGRVVSREEIVQAVWEGRALSPNAVAVVVSDLRRALGDDARAPRLIETVPKRGYRLTAAALDLPHAIAAPAEPSLASHGPAPGPPQRSRRLLGGALAAGVALLAVVAGVGLRSATTAPDPATVVTVNDVRNGTGDPRYDALATAISEIGAAYLARSGAPVLVRDRWDFDAADPSRGLYDDFGAAARVTHVSSTLVLQGGALRLVMFANDPRTDAVLWSHDAWLDEGRTDPVVERALADLLRTLAADAERP